MSTLFFNWVFGISGIFLLFLGISFDTPNLISSVFYKVVPSILGVLEIIYVLKSLDII